MKDEDSRGRAGSKSGTRADGRKVCGIDGRRRGGVPRDSLSSGMASAERLSSMEKRRKEGLVQTLIRDGKLLSVPI